MKKIALALVALTMVATPAHAWKFWGTETTTFESPRGGTSHAEVCKYRFGIKVSCHCNSSSGSSVPGPCGGETNPDSTNNPKKGDAKAKPHRAAPATGKAPKADPR